MIKHNMLASQLNGKCYGICIIERGTYIHCFLGVTKHTERIIGSFQLCIRAAKSSIDQRRTRDFFFNIQGHFYYLLETPLHGVFHFFRFLTFSPFLVLPSSSRLIEVASKQHTMHALYPFTLIQRKSTFET